MARRRARPGPGQMSLFEAPVNQPDRPQEPRRPSSSGRTRWQRAWDTRRANETEEFEEAKEAARQGDNSQLFGYAPTPSINPPRPRTLMAGYSAADRTIVIRFREGTAYEYRDVTPQEWRNFRRVQSPGRYINRVLNHKPYHPVDY